MIKHLKEFHKQTRTNYKYIQVYIDKNKKKLKIVTKQNQKLREMKRTTDKWLTNNNCRKDESVN